MKKLSKQDLGELGLYEFQGYIGAMTSPTFGGWDGTDKLIELLNIKNMNKPRILEVGCSTGYITRYIAQNFDCEIMGVDLSELLIDIAREEVLKSNLTNVSFEIANVEQLPFPDNSFDIVYGEAITALVSNPLKVLNEYKRVLRPNGKIATLDVFMKNTLKDEIEHEINEIMSIVIGTDVKIKNLQEWESIFQETQLNDLIINDFYEDIFKRSYSTYKMLKIMLKMIYHMIINKKIRQKVLPALKFARKFQKAIKENYFGYFIFTGNK